MIGRHLFADLYGVERPLLTSETELVEMLLRALRTAGFNVISHLSHRFPGADAGVTGIVLLSESHAAFHTYPEYGYVALDIFSCGTPSPDEALTVVADALQPRRVQVSTHYRGSDVREDLPPVQHSYNTLENGTSSALRTSSAARKP